MILPMDRLLQIIYRLGLAAIWLVALFWVLFGGMVFFRNGSNGNYDNFGLIMSIGALVVAVVAHLLWRWILGQKKKPKE